MNKAFNNFKTRNNLEVVYNSELENIEQIDATEILPLITTENLINSLQNDGTKIVEILQEVYKVGKDKIEDEYNVEFESLSSYAFYEYNNEGLTSAVGQKEPNSLALYDMGTMSPQESLDIAFNFSSIQI